MSGLNKLKKNVKRSSAIILSALMTATCVDASLLSVTSSTANAASSILSNEDRGVIYANSRTDFRDESIYFLITTRFYDGDSSNNARTSEDTKAKNPEDDPSWRGDFKGLIDKLDYIKALGFTAIWITPVVENDSGYDYHGYHAYDFSAVDTRYESNGITYQDLIDACHDKGMKVIQDIVLNHTCNWGEKNLLQLTSDVYSERNQVVMNGNGDPENIYHHNGFCGGGDWDNYEAQRKTIADDCFDLETENPKVYNYLVDCYTKYINMGVDGFRVDTVKHLPRLTLNSVFVPAFKKAGGDDFYMFGEVCTKGHDVWYRDNPPISTCFYTWADDSSWTSRWTDDLATNEALVDAHYTAHMDTGNQPTSTNAFLNGNDYHTPDNSVRSGLDAIDFQMHWSFNNANEAFNTALGEDRYFSDSTWNVVYVDSHDYGPDNCQTLRYNGGTDAWAENLSLMFTFRGIPCIYYGSEIEFQAGKQIDVGPNAPLSETGRAYYGDHIEGNVDTADFTVFGNLSGEVQNTLNSTLSQHIMRLNRIRQAVPALRKGQYSTEGCSGNIAFKRRYTDSTTDSFACVAISGSATFSGVPNGRYVDAVTGDVQNVSNGTLNASVSGKGNMKVYVLDTAKTPAPGRVIPNGNYLTDGGAAENIGPVTIDVKKVDPTGITLSKTSATIKEGTSEKITATITPSDATNKSVTWSSSNTSVATVAGGTITAVAKGTATITAKTSNGLTATVAVTVVDNPDIIKPTRISLNNSSLDLEAGKTDTLTATVAPSNATNKTVTWSSSDTSVATVNGGTVTAVAEGTATITASTFNGYKATCTVTVSPKSVTTIDNGVYFEKPSGWGSDVHIYLYDSSTNSTVGATWPGVSMTNSGDDVYTYEYTTSNSNLMIVFNDGGSNQAPAENGFNYVNQGYYTSSGYQYKVEKPAEILPTSVTLTADSTTTVNGETYAVVTENNTVKLTATVAPSNATNKTVTWKSSDTSVATVSGGTVTGIKAGTATITATTSNGKTASFKVNVSAATTLTNNTTLSKTSVQVGDTISVTGAASGGTGSYTYLFYYKKSGASSFTKFASTANGTFKPTEAGTYTIRTYVNDSTGAAARKDFTVTVTGGFTNNTTISSASVAIGSSITVTGAASGGSGSYSYEFYSKKSTATKFTKFGSSSSATFKPSEAGTYTIRTYAKDTAGNVAAKDFTVTVTGRFTNNTTINKTSVAVGGSVTVTGAASGGSGSYTYEFYSKKSTATKFTKFSSSASATFKPTEAGTYTIRTYVKDTAGNVAAKDFTVTVTGGFANNTTISSTSIAAGGSATLTGAASGGNGSYTYEFYSKKSTATKFTKFGSSATATFKPTETGTYTVRTYAKDTAGNVAAKDFTVTVSSSSALVNNSDYNVTDVITIQGIASGGSGSYTYEFYYKLSTNSKYTALKASGTTASFIPEEGCKYNVKVYVKDTAGNVAAKEFLIYT